MTDRSPARVHLLDVNVLVALCLTSHLHHRAAHAFLSTVQAWATTPVTETALYRLLLNPAVAGAHLSEADITVVVGGFRKDPRWRFLPDATRLADQTVTTAVLQGHRQVTDLHLAAVAKDSGAVLVTFDRALPSWLAPEDRAVVQVIDATPAD